MKNAFKTVELLKKDNTVLSFISKMLKNGELEKIDITGGYVNIITGETFISGNQLKKRYKISDRNINELTKKGYLCINGMEIKKV